MDIRERCLQIILASSRLTTQGLVSEALEAYRKKPCLNNIVGSMVQI